MEKTLELTLPVAAFTQVLSFLAQEFFKEDFLPIRIIYRMLKLARTTPPPSGVCPNHIPKYHDGNQLEHTLPEDAFIQG